MANIINLHKELSKNPAAAKAWAEEAKKRATSSVGGWFQVTGEVLGLAGCRYLPLVAKVVYLVRVYG